MKPFGQNGQVLIEGALTSHNEALGEIHDGVSFFCPETRLRASGAFPFRARFIGYFGSPQADMPPLGRNRGRALQR